MEDVSNYRPIGKLSFISKIFEKLTAIRFINFIGKLPYLMIESLGFVELEIHQVHFLHFKSNLYNNFEKKKYIFSIQ